MRSASSQRGVAAVVFLAIFALILIGVLTTAFGGRSVQNDFDAKTFPVLAAAKEALIAYAAANPNVPSRLPCPDTVDDGMQHCLGAGVDQIGRLPWKTLGLPDLRDGSGECLWYAVSGGFAETSPLTTPINSDTNGHFKVVDDASPSNNTLTGSTPDSLAIAVIFAAGPAFDTNDRTPPGPPTRCGGNMNAANYLDTAPNGVNNAVLAGSPPVFVAGTPSATFNDRLVYITPKEFFPRVERRIAAEIKKALQTYYLTNGSYPDANNYTPPYDCTASLTQGLLPFRASPGCASPTAWLPTWLTDDLWHTVTYYTVDPGSTLTVLNTPAPNNNKQALVIMAGRKLTGQVRPCGAVADCLDGPVNTSGSNTYESRPISPTFNDIVVIAAP